MPNFRYKALTQARRDRHRLDRGADRGRGRAPHRVSRPRAGRYRHRGARPRARVSFFTLTQAREVRGRDRVHARPRAAAEGRRAARRCARTAVERFRRRPPAPDGREDPRRDPVGRELRRGAGASSVAVPADVSSRWCGSAKPPASLDEILEVLAAERARAEALRRKLGDALRYPAFVLFAATAVLVFFLLFVLPQFASVLRDFNAKLDPIVLIVHRRLGLPARATATVLARRRSRCIAGTLVAVAPPEHRASRSCRASRACR